MIRRALKALQAAVAPSADNTSNVHAAAAHSTVEAASFTRRCDDDNGPRVAVQCHALGHPMWRIGCADELELRIRDAWPLLATDEVRRVRAHLEARVRVALEAPSRDAAVMRDARRDNWVFGWQHDHHDTGVAR